MLENSTFQTTFSSRENLVTLLISEMHIRKKTIAGVGRVGQL